jgi:hypothetical protein
MSAADEGMHDGMHEFHQGLLRCETCGEIVGEWHGHPPDLGSDRIIVRCYACLALEEAEAITAAAADGGPLKETGQ